jgi:LysR family hydrogen peroxide-inducible transcriptional activator
MNITLRQFHYFEALARHGHFGRAASACAISQPALSVQVRELERRLGATLFERGAKGVTLTAFGAAFAPRARDILRSVDELEDLARAARGGLAGRLRIGVIPTVAPYILPALAGAVAAAHPEAALELRETMTSILLRELADGRLDTALVALPLNERGLTEMPLLREPFVLVRPEAEAAVPVPTAEGLAKMRLLLLEEGHCFRDQALALCATRPRAALDGTSLSTLVQMVGAGLGVTLIPEMAVAVETRAAPVAIARFPDPAPTRTLGLVWRRTSPLAGPLKGLAQVIGRAIANSGGMDQGRPRPEAAIR